VADEDVQVEQPAETALPPPPPQVPRRAARPPDPVLARYSAQMRRSRTSYFAILGVIVAAISIWVGVEWSRGEISHASLRTFAPPPPSVAIAPPAQVQHQVWRTADRIALGQPQWGGTIVTYGPHTVGGREARNGSRTWSYTRTDRTVCTAAQLTGTTIAVFRNKGNCDELSAFDSDTGRRRWTRTLDEDGKPLNGTPSYQVTPYTMLIASHAVIYAIDPVTGYDRWTYWRYGCDIQHVALGSAGALISQNCTSKHACRGQKFCALGPQLVLRNNSDGRDDKSTTNPDKIIWNLVGNTDVPVSADNALVSAATRAGGRLQVFTSDKGRVERSIPLTPATSAFGPITAYETDTAEVVWLGGMSYAVASDTHKTLWRVDSGGPPTVVSTTNVATPTLATARIVVPTNSGVATVDGNDGQLIQNYVLPAPQSNSVVYSLGNGFLVTSTGGIAAYR
jgi:PQQ-like domain